jgi:hypothetical protein
MQYPTQQISLWRRIMQNPSQEIWTSKLFHAIPKSTNFQLQIIPCNIHKDQEIFTSSPFAAIPKSTNFLQNLLASDHAMCIAAKGCSGREGEGEGGLEKHHCTQIGAKNHTKSFHDHDVANTIGC